MQPSPVVIKGMETDQVNYAENQPEYDTLPSLRSLDGRVTSRWTFTDEERRKIAEGADILLTLYTFNKPLQPIQMRVIPENAHNNDYWRMELIDPLAGNRTSSRITSLDDHPVLSQHVRLRSQPPH
jgi:hypothetical protein